MDNSIRQMREKLSMSQVELSKKSGISRQTIIALESGEHTNILTSTLVSIAKALGCSVLDIISPDVSTEVDGISNLLENEKDNPV